MADLSQAAYAARINKALAASSNLTDFNKKQLEEAATVAEKIYNAGSAADKKAADEAADAKLKAYVASLKVKSGADEDKELDKFNAKLAKDLEKA